MSIEIDWDALTTGPEGRELAASIRAFIHDKFQEADLPGFIRSVEVHDFEFGDACPSIVIKDICDPLPDFYEDDDDEEDSDEPHLRPSEHVAKVAPLPQEPALSTSTQALHGSAQTIPAPLPLQKRRSASKLLNLDPSKQPSADDGPVRPSLHRQNLSLAEQLASPLLSRSSTPGIPGGTSSLSYFHLPLAGRMQGSAVQSPLAAVAGWQEHQAQLHAQRIGGYAPAPQASRHSNERRLSSPTQTGLSDTDPSTRPSTSNSHEHPAPHGLQPLTDLPSSVTPSRPEPDPRDMQTVLHISYSGNVRLALTAEILLDYPMPSFVSIPLKLNITGLSFDGVALVALLHSSRTKDDLSQDEADAEADADEGDRRAHFCFLGQEDAETLVGAESILDADVDVGDAAQLQARREGEQKVQIGGEKLGSLLREMRVETEIGKTRDGRQNLKNVGKVEKFILEQVRRIFEDEFVYPSFWTFLV